MTNRSCLPGPTFALATAVLVVTLMTGCTQTQQTQQTASLAPPPPSEKVFVTFEGPWGFAPDPKDASFVIAMAPKTKDHRDLYVRASNNQALASGVYDLSMPPRTAPPNGTIAPGLVQTKIDAKDVQRVLDDNKQERYAIRLPKPEAYTPASRFASLVGSAYPPTMVDDHATAVSLQYSVGSLNTFQLAGNVDSGSFPPFVLKLDTPAINFVIAPAHDDDPADKCLTHARQAFHDLTKLLGVTLYVDFPNSPSNCHDKDPQKPPAAKAQLALPLLLERMATFAGTDAADVQEAGIAPGVWLNSAARRPLRFAAQRLMAAFAFFAQPSAGCKTPIIVGNGN